MNEQKIERYIDELYALQKNAGERMVELTEENKTIARDMFKIQDRMNSFYQEKMENVENNNGTIGGVILIISIIGLVVFLLCVWSMKSMVTENVEILEARSDNLYKVNKEIADIMNSLYKDQMKFIENNKCNIEGNKKSTENKKKGKGK